MKRRGQCDHDAGRQCPENGVGGPTSWQSLTTLAFGCVQTPNPQAKEGAERGRDGITVVVIMNMLTRP